MGGWKILCCLKDHQKTIEIALPTKIGLFKCYLLPLGIAFSQFKSATLGGAAGKSRRCVPETVNFRLEISCVSNFPDQGMSRGHLTWLKKNC